MAGLLDFGGGQGSGGLLGDLFSDPGARIGLGLLAASSPRLRGLGQVMAQQDQAKEQSLQRQLMQAQLDDRTMQTQARQAQAMAEQRKQQALPDMFGQGGGMPAAPGGEATQAGPQASMQPGSLNWMRGLQAGYTPKQLMELAELQNIGRSEVARTIETTDAQNRPITVQLDKYGNRIGDGLNSWKAPLAVNQGDRTTMVDPATMQPRGSFGINMSQSERDASARGWAGNAIARERLSMDKADAGPGGVKAPAGYRWGADGNLVPIPGGPAEKANVATEGERKAATLLQRLEGSQSQYLSALKDDRGAAKPGLIANGLRTVGAEALANTVTGENRQRVEAAQLDMLDAALTLGTGAAYTREQLEGYRKSYFPQIGDDPKTVAEKKDRLDNVIGSARIAAGRAGKSVAPQSGGATGGWGDKPIPQGAINDLKMRGPKAKAQFDEVFGAGAADRALGGR